MNFSPHDTQAVGYGHLFVGLIMAILAGTMGQRPDGTAYPAHIRYTQGALALSLLMVGYCWLTRQPHLLDWTKIWLFLTGLQAVFVIKMGTKKPVTESDWLHLLKRAAPFSVLCLAIIGFEVGLSWNFTKIEKLELKNLQQTEAVGRKMDTMGVQLDTMEREVKGIYKARNDTTIR